MENGHRDAEECDRDDGHGGHHDQSQIAMRQKGECVPTTGPISRWSS